MRISGGWGGVIGPAKLREEYRAARARGPTPPPAARPWLSLKRKTTNAAPYRCGCRRIRCCYRSAAPAVARQPHRGSRWAPRHLPDVRKNGGQLAAEQIRVAKRFMGSGCAQQLTGQEGQQVELFYERWKEGGKKSKPFVEAALRDAHRVAAGLVEREGERARDDARLPVQACDGQRAPAILPS